jgi:hypothetical protein
MTVIVPFPARRQPTAPLRRAGGGMDRAAIVATTLAGIYARALRARLAGDGSAVACVKLEVEEILRDEFYDVQQRTLAEIRTECE